MVCFPIAFVAAQEKIKIHMQVFVLFTYICDKVVTNLVSYMDIGSCIQKY